MPPTGCSILLDPIAGFQEANRDSDNKFTTASLLVARGKGALTQEIELILVEAALQAQKQTVITLAWCINRFLLDQDGIDDAAHLDELLPISAVPGEARYLARRHGANLPRQTSATIRSNPARATPPAAERPRSSSTVSMCDHPSAASRERMAY